MPPPKAAANPAGGPTAPPRSLKVTRKNVAVFTATGCKACENAILDIHYQVSSLARWAHFTFWPYVLGSSWEDLEKSDELDVCFFAGAIRTASDEEAALKLRQKSKILVAFGACAAFGGMPGLSNLHPGGESALCKSPSDDDCPELPPLRSRVAALQQIVQADYILPGCSPPQNYIWAILQSLVCQSESAARISFAASRLPQPIAQAVMAGVLPPGGSIFAGEKAVCASCARIKEEKRFESFKRIHQIDPDPGRCLLEQGLLCQGIATREGCGGLCTGAGVPCRGCFGKAGAVFDPGAKMVSAVSSTFDTTDGEEMKKIAEEFVDLAGTFYRYTMPAQCALLQNRKELK
ncbi:cytosolic bidirectional (NiFe)-hydrogenase (HDR linked, Group 3c), small subunit, putative [Syntrophobacter sp. SbD1]|nr:cytosolic bidirectional (NiFe)-hydrogenase (HDR linked, Group 3c), small subunit, putative [Syntrophobacter sp. SbD1]